MGIQARTLELFGWIGIRELAVDRGVPVTEFHVLREGTPMLHASTPTGCRRTYRSDGVTLPPRPRSMSGWPH